MSNKEKPEKQTSDENWARMIKHSPVRVAIECRDALADHDKGYHRNLYETLQTIYKLSAEFDKKRTKWSEFTEEPFFGKLKQKKPKQTDDREAIILWTTKFVFRAVHTSSTQYNRAYKHARTLQKHLKDGVTEDELFLKLSQEGADYAFRIDTVENPRQEGRNPAKNITGKAKEAEGGSSVFGSFIDDEENEGEPDRPMSGPGKPPKSKGNEPRLHTDFDDDDSEKTIKPEKVPVLEVELTTKKLGRLLALKDGEQAELTVERVPGQAQGRKKDWVRFVLKRTTLIEEG